MHVALFFLPKNLFGKADPHYNPHGQDPQNLLPPGGDDAKCRPLFQSGRRMDLIFFVRNFSSYIDIVHFAFSFFFISKFISPMQKFQQFDCA